MTLDPQETSPTDWPSLSSREIESARCRVEAFLLRWGDGFTRAHRQELVQDAVVVALSRFHTVADKARFHSFVRTIARRRRAAAIAEQARLPIADLDVDWIFAQGVVQPEPEEVCYEVAGSRVPHGMLAAALPQAMAHLTQLNARLLASFYEGFSCCELAERYGLTTHGVKVRVHRSRQRLKKLLRRDVIRRLHPGRTTRRHLRPTSKDSKHVGASGSRRPAAPERGAERKPREKREGEPR